MNNRNMPVEGMGPNLPEPFNSNQPYFPSVTREREALGYVTTPEEIEVEEVLAEVESKLSSSEFKASYKGEVGKDSDLALRDYSELLEAYSEQEYEKLGIANELVMAKKVKAAIALYKPEMDSRILYYRLKGELAVKSIKYNSLPESVTKYIPYSSWDWHVIIASDTSIPNHAVAPASTVFKPSSKTYLESTTSFILPIYSETLCVCTETGISFSVKVPSLDATEFQYLHPFAFISNVERELASFAYKGIKIEQFLDSQTLAGMLITILRAKSLAVSSNWIEANLFLQSADSKMMAYAVRFFNGMTSSKYLPKFRIDFSRGKDFYLARDNKKLGSATAFLGDMIQVCTNDTTIAESATYASAKQAPSLTVKILTDEVAQQFKGIKTDSKIAAKLLARLESHYSSSATFLSQVKANLKNLPFMKDSAKYEIARQLNTIFPEDGDAQELANIFKHSTTEAIEADLLTFSQEYDKEQGQQTVVKNGKVDFLSLMRKAGQQVKEGE